MTETIFNGLVEQCMKSGFFRTREAAEKYVLENCMPKPEPKFEEGEEVFENKTVEEVVSKYNKWLD